jgi:membrane protease YdiL (CAAX protease family)
MSQRRLFFGLLLACLAVSLMVLPFVVSLGPQPSEPITAPFLIAAIAPNVIEFAIAIFVGLSLAKRVGFEVPVLEGKKPWSYLKSILPLSVGLGVAAAVAIILLSFLSYSVSLSLLKLEMSVAWWQRLLASFEGGIAEEVLYRLFLMTLFVWIASKLRHTADGRPTNSGIWVANVLAAVLFGLGHLGFTAGLVALTPQVIVRAVLLNGVAGVVYGWLYWKKGLESAMIAHFSTDLTLHVVTPAVAAWFV